jgi:hypothetical protein
MAIVCDKKLVTMRLVRIIYKQENIVLLTRLRSVMLYLLYYMYILYT